MYSIELSKELDQLSLEVFGTKTKWKKLVENGKMELVTEDTKRLYRENGEEKTEIVKTPLAHVGSKGGELNKYVLKRYTVDEIKAKMLQIKKQMDDFKLHLEKQKEEQETVEKAKKIVESGSGSVL
jgi:hypothetical protein